MNCRGGGGSAASFSQRGASQQWTEGFLLVSRSALLFVILRQNFSREIVRTSQHKLTKDFKFATNLSTSKIICSGQPFKLSHNLCGRQTARLPEHSQVILGAPWVILNLSCVKFSVLGLATSCVNQCHFGGRGGSNRRRCYHHRAGRHGHKRPITGERM